MKDYYKILGISSTASSDEVKKAFKNLAKKFHPDLNKGNKADEERFKEISEAYDTLGNPESRKNYDIQRDSEERFQRMGGDQFNSGDFSSGFGNISGGMEEILNRLSQGFLGGTFRQQKGRRTRSPFGQHPGPFNEQSYSETPSGNLSVPLKVACKGGEILVSGLPNGPRKVFVPPGTKPESLISIDTLEGSFKLKVSIENDPPFSLKGEIVEATISINIAQALLGGKVKIRDPKDSEVILTVPSGSQPGDILRLKGLGLAGGDLFIRLNIEIPKNLNELQRKLFEEFSRELGLKR